MGDVQIPYLYVSNREYVIEYGRGKGKWECFSKEKASHTLIIFYLLLERKLSLQRYLKQKMSGWARRLYPVDSDMVWTTVGEDLACLAWTRG